MNQHTTETRLREIAERENKATKGPWKDHGVPHPAAVRILKEAAGVSSDSCLIYSQPRDYGCLPETFNRQLSDAEFIAHSRQDVPWLLALIKKQREALEADALADKLFERAEAHREESIACGYDNDPTGSLAVTESYKAANAQALIATQLKKDALNFSPENL